MTEEAEKLRGENMTLRLNLDGSKGMSRLMREQRDAWRADAMRLAEPLEEFRRQRHEVQLGVPDEVTTALAAHDALVAKEGGK